MADMIKYSKISEMDMDEVVMFMAKHFYPREPLSTGLHMTYEDNKEWIHCSVRDWVKIGVSVVARDTTTHEIIGSCLATILTRTQNTSFDEALNSPKTKVKTLHKVLSVLEDSVNFFAKYKVNKILEIAMVTAHEDYSGRGIGRRLIEETESHALKLGCQLATAQATAISSQKVLEKLGFQSLYEMDYASFTIEGEPVFDMENMLGSPSAKVMSKMLVPPIPIPARIKCPGWKNVPSYNIEDTNTKSNINSKN